MEPLIREGGLGLRLQARDLADAGVYVFIQAKG